MKSPHAIIHHLFLLLSLGAVLSTAAAQGSRPLIQVRSDVTVSSAQVTLGDLADVQATDETISARLRAVTLGYAPNVGLLRQIPREKIALAIAAAGFAVGTVQLESPAQVTVRRAAQTIDPARIQAEVERVTLAEFNAGGAMARLVKLDLPSAIAVPAGKVEIRAVPGTARNLFAPFQVFVELWVDGRITNRFAVTTLIEAHAPVLVAVRDVPANVRLQREDFRLAVRRLDKPVASYLRDPNQLRGMTLRAAIVRDEPLTTDALVAGIIIRPGDEVRILARSNSHTSDKGCLQIVVAGEARGAGRIGDLIAVRNKVSGVLIQAKVMDEGMVQVLF